MHSPLLQANSPKPHVLTGQAGLMGASSELSPQSRKPSQALLEGTQSPLWHGKSPRPQPLDPLLELAEVDDEVVDEEEVVEDEEAPPLLDVELDVEEVVDEAPPVSPTMISP